MERAAIVVCRASPAWTGAPSSAATIRIPDALLTPRFSHHRSGPARSRCIDQRNRYTEAHGDSSEQSVRGIPRPDAGQDLAILGDLAVTEAAIEMTLVGRLEDGIEAFVEEERDGE